MVGIYLQNSAGMIAVSPNRRLHQNMSKEDWAKWLDRNLHFSLTLDIRSEQYSWIEKELKGRWAIIYVPYTNDYSWVSLYFEDPNEAILFKLRFG